MCGLEAAPRVSPDEATCEASREWHSTWGFALGARHGRTDVDVGDSAKSRNLVITMGF
jgi:hypothetical protein